MFINQRNKKLELEDAIENAVKSDDEDDFIPKVIYHKRPPEWETIAEFCTLEGLQATCRPYSRELSYF